MRKMDRDKILYAEDDSSWRLIFSEALKKNFQDYDLEIFEDGTSLRERLSKGIEDRVKLIVLDNKMPGIDGSEIVAEYASIIKAPMFLIYGGKEKIGEQAVRDGAVGYTLKPARPSELIKAIREVWNYSTD